MLNLTTQLTNTLSPQLYQYLKMLQMNNAELDAHILDLYESNPMLEIEKESTPPTMELHFDSIHPTYSKQSHTESNRTPDMMDLVAATDSNESIYNSLCLQVDLLKLPTTQRKLIYFLIADVDENGYLSSDILDELMEQYHVTSEDAAEALAVLQTLEPCGVGARSLSECLTIQLKRLYPNERLALAIAHNHLEDISKARYRKVAKAQKTVVEAVIRAADIIRELDPRPGSVFYSNKNAPYIRPDVMITRDGSRMIISLQNSRANRIAISPHYKQMLTETDDRELKRYLSEKQAEAQNALKNIEMRSSTMLSCTAKIIEHQTAFFTGLEKAPRPYTQLQLSEELELNPSTISRALSGKYLQCDRGIFPMSYFFPSEVSSGNDNAPSSSADVSALIAELVKKENKCAPLSDRDIQIALEQEGLYVSRRSIANYRSRMNIPSAALRKCKR